MKKIRSQTMLFLFIVLFVKVFKDIFGTSNTLVGVSTLIALLILMNEDSSQSVTSNFIVLILLNVGSGVVTFFASQQLLLGVILNVISFYMMGYYLTERLNKTILIPFGLQYLFMLYTPVQKEDVMMRLVALFIGALLIGLVPMIIKKRTVSFTVNRKNKPLMSLSRQAVAEIRDKFNLIKHKQIHSVRFYYAMRLAFAVAFASFIVDIFAIDQGRWIVYTVFSLTEFQQESCRKRAKQRLTGTIMGIILVLSLFTVIQTSFLRQAVVLLGGYLDAFTRNYQEKIICVTISVVASGALMNQVFLVAIERISFVSLGVLIAIIANKTIIKPQDIYVYD
ncbi:hypothetical protein HMI01_26220 [Halolactibacillus miurensis]|uniref:Fusaric acid resistance protein-like n=1 Tax=Halolactibacillus miurensis TaxID=306541 RepID=A0A1I6UWH5_9BACI|nr:MULTISPECIES: FUSC family protein [Halolactibacillus]GEM05634.1 hypothetical protein HMI01_26220 [Halolactibacillus miurensis]SFT05776.1 Fusaric acid resistance protein-like [Halolactibacillus miurensis]